MRVQMFSWAFLIILFFSNTILGTHDSGLVSGQCLQDQKDLLLQFRNNLTYDSSLSNKLVKWDGSIDCCRWDGVECDNRGHVIALDLSSESISDGIGGADNSLFRLEFLQRFNLAQNSFDSVRIPSGFGKLADLQYLNLSNSGFSGQVPLDFSNLSRLVVLDLSTSIPSFITLDNPNLKTLIRNLGKLQELYLDGVNVSSQGYDWCKAISNSLPNLRVLSLSNAFLFGPLDSSLLKIQSLSIIHLDGNTFSSPFPNFFTNFPNLRVLTMSSCDLSGVVPGQLFQIPSLQTIDLSNNRNLKGTLPEFPPNGSLQNLLLSYTQFSGYIPESMGGLRNLSKFDLRSCNFSGRIPTLFTNFTELVYVDLSLNQFTGSVPSFALLRNLAVINLRYNRLRGRIPDSLWEGLENLYFLDLSENSLEGEIPSSLFRLPSLKVLDLNDNRFSGLSMDSINISFSLESLDLSVNSLRGFIPRFLFDLYNLSSLSLSWNEFDGYLDVSSFHKLTELVNLDLSHNNLSVHISDNASISSLFPRLGTLMLSSCKLRKIPLLRNQSSLKMLDLSDNLLKDNIPNWIWEVGDGSLRFMNLSHNQLTGLQEPYVIRGLDFLDLQSNIISGKIPLPPPSVAYVDLSRNKLSSSLPTNIGNSLRRAYFFSISNNNVTGSVPPSFCNASSLQLLDLSNNSLNGRIPSCVIAQTIHVLNVGRNNLDGDIPDAFPVSCGLQSLDISWNGFQGKIPRSLAKCKDIEVLNFGHNDLHDEFPCWFKNFTRLRVLDLSFNTFYGNVSCLGKGLESSISGRPSFQKRF